MLCAANFFGQFIPKEVKQGMKQGLKSRKQQRLRVLKHPNPETNKPYLKPEIALCAAKTASP